VAAVSAELPAAAGFRVRMELPAPALERLGVDVRPMTLLSEEEGERFGGLGSAARGRLVLAARRRMRARLDAQAGDFDVALVYRRADLLPGTSLERRAARGHRLVYDVDDAIWLESRRDSGTHPLAGLKGSRRKARLMAERADHVIAGSPILAEHLGAFTSSISVVPSLVDPAAVPLRSHGDSPRLVLGWIGSGSTARFVDGIRPALERVAAACPELELSLLTVGGSTRPVAGLVHESHAWSAAAQLDALSRMDVGLMPLPDTPWNRGKCAYKALQYMAAGVPVVADDVGIARDVIGDGQAGHVVAGEDAWVEATTALLRDRALRERLGHAGRERVERDYSVERWAPELARILRGHA
jgi:glycosyltransferase involved in cell wall biosynthesis